MESGNLFVEGVMVRLACVSEKAASRRELADNKAVASARVRCSGKWGVHYYELVAWDERALELELAVPIPQLRMIAYGVPGDEIYHNKIQHKLTVEQLFVEDVDAGELVERMSLAGTKADAVEQRVMAPLSVPAALSPFGNGGSQNKPSVEESGKAVDEAIFGDKSKK